MRRKDLAAELLATVGERVDQLMSLDVTSRGVVSTLYRLVRTKLGEPLCMAAARLLEHRVNPGQVVFIATGQPDRPTINRAIAESDGPPGAAVLARGLNRALAAVPIVLVEEALVPGVAAILQAAEFSVVAPEEAVACVAGELRAAEKERIRGPTLVGIGVHSPIHGVAVLGFPTRKGAARARAKALIETYRPAAVVTVEKGSMNDRGFMFGTRGTELAEGHIAKADYLVLEAKARGIATIGVGDGGNEIGFGVVEDEIKRHIPYGAVAKVPGKGGIAAHTATDVMVAAAISNWGAYGIAACLAARVADLEVFHDSSLEARILGASAQAGFIDGVTGLVASSVDSLPLAAHQAFVTLMRATVERALARLHPLVRSDGFSRRAPTRRRKGRARQG